MTPDFPVGISDLTHGDYYGDAEQRLGDHWYWCRRHQEPEHVNTPTKRDDDPTVACIRIGPFMSEHEAQRLAGAGQIGMRITRPPLGMEVEK